MAEILYASDEDGAAGLTASLLADALARALAVRPEASLIVTGGRTPRLVLPRLAAADLPWHRIVVTLTDERWVEVSHPDSNEGQARRLLPQGVRFVGLKTDHPSPSAALTAVAERLAAIPRPFDAVFLGMGEDGHIASLFPGIPMPQDGLVAAAVAPDGMPRISLTSSALLDSRLVVIPAIGPTKTAVLKRALEPGPVDELPVRAVLGNQGELVKAVLVATDD